MTSSSRPLDAGQGPARTIVGIAARVYLPALVLLAVAVLVRPFLTQWLGGTPPFVTILGAVAAAAWSGGARPATLVAILGYVAVAWMPGAGGSGPAEAIDPGGWIAVTSYVFTCTLVAGLGDAARRSRLRHHQTDDVLRVILHGIGDAVVTTDVEGRVTSMNAAAESLTGWNARDGIGARLDLVVSLVNAATREQIGSPVIGNLQEGVIVGVARDTILIARDGRERHIDERTAPLRDEWGQPSGVVMVLRDVTEPRRLERERDAALGQLRRFTSARDAGAPLESA